MSNFANNDSYNRINNQSSSQLNTNTQKINSTRLHKKSKSITYEFVNSEIDYYFKIHLYLKFYF